MELALVVVLGVPLGRLVPSRKLAWTVLGLAWLVVLPFQTASVHDEGHVDAAYWPMQLLVAALGAGFIVVGAKWRARHEAQAAVVGAS